MIKYIYDHLYCLKAASYLNGDYYHYNRVYPELAEEMPLVTARPK